MAALDEIAAQDFDEDGIGLVGLARHRARFMAWGEATLPGSSRRCKRPRAASAHCERRAWHADLGSVW
jgi:hypothetical protein